MSVSLIDGHIDDDTPRMTDNEIIKAFECCVTYEFCTGCPLVDNCPSSYLLLKSALDLINRQKAEIEALIAGQETMSKYIEEQKAEIESFKEECSCLGCENEWLKAHYERSKAETVKEFAERYEIYLLSQMTTAPLDKKEWINFCLDELDNLKKEMVGEG